MAKDHFQDIIPPHEPLPRQYGTARSRMDEDADGDETQSITTASSDKSIRNINVTRRGAPAEAGRMAPSRRSRLWIWVLAGACALALLFLIGLYVFSRTTVTVVPHSQPVIFDRTMQFTAYPASSASSGLLSYSLESVDLEDSEPVAASGTVHKEEKASGTITVYNDYSTSPVKLLKNTRFETSSGLIFKTPAAVQIPGKKGSAPGKVDVTVVADIAGSQYNIAAGQKVTLPGLKPTPVMYTGVYGIISGATTGGFSGDVPNVPDSALSAAHSAIRARLEQKISATVGEDAAAAMPLAPIVRYAELSPVQENGSVKVREGAHVDVVMLDKAALAQAVAELVAANSSTISYSIVPGDDFTATAVDAAARPGTDPVTFSITGSATLVAVIDSAALANALAGRDSVAFDTIVANFPGVDSALARIEPFWESKFPKNASDIRIVVRPAGETP